MDYYIVSHLELEITCQTNHGNLIVTKTDIMTLHDFLAFFPLHQRQAPSRTRLLPGFMLHPLIVLPLLYSPSLLKASMYLVMDCRNASASVEEKNLSL
jgi:hypothetical protein